LSDDAISIRLTRAVPAHAEQRVGKQSEKLKKEKTHMTQFTKVAAPHLQEVS